MRVSHVRQNTGFFRTATIKSGLLFRPLHGLTETLVDSYVTPSPTSFLPAPRSSEEREDKLFGPPTETLRALSTCIRDYIRGKWIRGWRDSIFTAPQRACRARNWISPRKSPSSKIYYYSPSFSVPPKVHDLRGSNLSGNRGSNRRNATASNSTGSVIFALERAPMAAGDTIDRISFLQVTYSLQSAEQKGQFRNNGRPAQARRPVFISLQAREMWSADGKFPRGPLH